MCFPVAGGDTPCELRVGTPSLGVTTGGISRRVHTSLAPSELAALLDCTDVALLIFGGEATIAFASRAAADLFRCAPSDLVGLTTFDPTWDVVRADGSPLPAERRPVAEAARTKVPVRDVELGIRRDPSHARVWLTIDAMPRLGPDGSLVHVVVTLRDVTEEHDRRVQLERLRTDLREVEDAHASALADLETELASRREALLHAQRELAMREQLYWSAFEVIGEGLVVHREDGSIETANPAAERILGRTLDELRGSSALDRSWRLVAEDGSPLGPEAIPSEITRTTGRSVIRALLGVERGDGTRTWLHVSTHTLRAGTGESVGVVATFADVTREREARMAVERSEARFRQVLSAVPGVVFQLLRSERDARFTFLSDRALELFWETPDTLMSDHDLWGDLLSPESLRDGLRRLDRSPEPNTTCDLTLQVRRTERFVRVRAVSEQLDGSTLWTGVAYDVTHEHRLADQLRDSQRREAMGELAAGVAHNFNNVLAVILPNLEELREEASPALVPVADDALNAAQNAAEMVRQLLLTTRREPVHDREAVDLVPVATDVVRLCRQSFGRRIDLALETSTSPAIVLARTSEVHQVLLNLCINARDALVGVEEPRLELRVDIVGEHVVIEVRDNGVGMDAKTRARVGEPFFTTKPPGQGTGLGLATAFTILRELHAEVTLESEVGRGTLFRIRFPRAEATVPRRRVRDRARPIQGRHRVLLVEDEALVRRATQRLLERLGHQVLTASDGVEGLRLATTEDLDLVLLDLSMPRLGGDAVLAELRARRPELPVVMLSGHVPDGVALEGAAAVLIKPVLATDLTATLARVLR